MTEPVRVMTMCLFVYSSVLIAVAIDELVTSIAGTHSKPFLDREMLGGRWKIDQAEFVG